eukprot:TRINITY_DN2902_c0_g1_i1.p1 TRINITY_DN2902_c0_g1~~TRINITY_DN2902_c0_g1_i1.p1  ORF type:complete len:337 (-),score=69.53 TRINITY_DN2902_c0_g1_i1:1364-2374(-)
MDPHSYHSEGAFCIPSLTSSNIQVKKYFFQFFVPDNLVCSQSKDLLPIESLVPDPLHDHELSNCNKSDYKGIEDGNLGDFSCGDNYCENDSIAHNCVNEFEESLINCFEYPVMNNCTPVLHGIVAVSQQRLTQLLTPTIKISVSESASLLLNFLKLTAPSIKSNDTNISHIWQYYKSLDNTGLEIFKSCSNNSVQMAVYSASLYGIHIKTKEREEIEYLERDPQYAQIPLFKKVQELSLKYPSLFTLSMADMEEDSWFGVCWVPLVCVPHLKIAGRFLTLYKLVGCSRIAVDCCNLDACEYWREVLEDKESKELVEEEKEKALRFLSVSTTNLIIN